MEWKWKVRDHDHFTGKFRGAAHNICNLKMQDRKFILVIAHNLSKYDLKFFIRDLMRYTDGDTDTLPLADIWQVFTNETIKTYGLDPHHYITLPSLSWDAMFKYTDVEIELMSDPNITLMYREIY